MSNSRAAIRYAKAILDMANSKSVALEVSQDMTLIENTIQANLELSTFIHNPTIRVEVKESALLEVFASINKVTKGLFHLLFKIKDSKYWIPLQWNIIHYLMKLMVFRLPM